VKTTFYVILLAISVLLMSLTYYHNVHAEKLKVLESQLNKNSITGVIQNPYNFTVGGMTVRAEFYDKDDGHLVGLRDFGYVTKQELKPNEKASYKIYEEAGDTGEFPKTDFIVKAEGDDWTNAEDISIEDYANNVTRALKSIPTEIVTNVIVYENGTRVVTNTTEIHKNNTD
jgi:hypothetical protein